MFIGPSDLAASFGKLGSPADPVVQDAIQGAAARLAKVGTPAGILATNAADARRYRDWGFQFVAGAVAEVGPYLGRLVVANEKSAGGSFPPGCVFPQAQHGGPGRAGCGAELGGRLGLELYMQRTAIQGGASQLARMFGKPKASE